MDRGELVLISVIIATHRREELALGALRSVVDDASGPCEILIVDQDRTGRLGARIADEFDGHEHIRHLVTDIVGLSQARNLGAARAHGEVLAFLDDDARACPGWLAGYAAAFAADATMVGGRILPEWEAPLPRWYPPSRLHLLGLFDGGDRMIPFPSGSFPVGANFAILGHALRHVGGFSPELGFRAGATALAGEDTLLALRVIEAGGLILYQPQATATHRIRRDKLDLGYFIGRHFLEGRTQIEVAVRCGSSAWPPSPATFGGNAARPLVAALRWLRSLVSRGSWLQDTADFLASVSLSFGALFQCGLRWTRRERSLTA